MPEGTLTANETTTVTLASRAYQVTVATDGAEIWFTTDGSNPAYQEDRAHRVPRNGALTVAVDSGTDPTVVKLRASRDETAGYTVTAGAQTDTVFDAEEHAATDHGDIPGVGDPAGSVAAHAADTSDVHGVADTTDLATTADIQAAIDALVAAAPGALDTLNELAAALGDDADFAVTITAALAGKETAGVAASAVSTHAAAADPHVGYVLESLIDAAGDLIVGTAADTVGRLAKGNALDGLRVKADGTGLEWASQATIAATTQADSYTLALADAGTVVELTKATANTLTVPPNSSVAFPVGTVIELFQYGAGQVTVAAGAGVTIRSSGGKLKLTGQYSGASLRKRATDEWSLIGDIAT